MRLPHYAQLHIPDSSVRDRGHLGRKGSHTYLPGELAYELLTATDYY